MVIRIVLRTIRMAPLWQMKGAADGLSGEGISSVNHAAGHAYNQTSDLWTTKVELSDNSGLFQSGLCQSQPVLICKESVKMQTKTG